MIHYFLLFIHDSCKLCDLNIDEVQNGNNLLTAPKGMKVPSSPQNNWNYPSIVKPCSRQIEFGEAIVAYTTTSDASQNTINPTIQPAAHRHHLVTFNQQSHCAADPPLCSRSASVQQIRHCAADPPLCSRSATVQQIRHSLNFSVDSVDRSAVLTVDMQ